MSIVKLNEMALQKHEAGFTLFRGAIIASDAPYKRLEVEEAYKVKFLEMLKSWSIQVDEEDKATLNEWIKEIEVI